MPGSPPFHAQAFVPINAPEAFFLPVDDAGRPGQRFCLFHRAQTATPLGCVLYIHPFAEEMNKSRRMAALQARALAQAGYAVLQIDLLGCGDSSGDFGDASWQDWIHDVVRGAGWLRQRVDAPLWLWGLRGGSLLAAQAAVQLDAPCNFIFWAPVVAGKLLLQQFLRLKAAGDMLSGNVKGVTEALREQLASGIAVEVAGYALSPALAHGLAQTSLDPPACISQSALPARVEWFELSTRDDAVLSPVSSKTSAVWAETGYQVRTHMANGPAFWQTSEIEEASALITATVAAMATLQQPIAA